MSIVLIQIWYMTRHRYQGASTQCRPPTFFGYHLSWHKETRYQKSRMFPPPNKLSLVSFWSEESREEGIGDSAWEQGIGGHQWLGIVTGNSSEHQRLGIVAGKRNRRSRINTITQQHRTLKGWCIRSGTDQMRSRRGHRHRIRYRSYAVLQLPSQHTLCVDGGSIIFHRIANLVWISLFGSLSLPPFYFVSIYWYSSS